MHHIFSLLTSAAAALQLILVLSDCFVKCFISKAGRHRDRPNACTEAFDKHQFKLVQVRVMWGEHTEQCHAN